VSAAESRASTRRARILELDLVGLRVTRAARPSREGLGRLHRGVRMEVRPWGGQVDLARRYRFGVVMPVPGG